MRRMTNWTSTREEGVLALQSSVLAAKQFSWTLKLSGLGDLHFGLTLRMPRPASWYRVGRGFEDLEIYMVAQLWRVSSVVQLLRNSGSQPPGF